MAKKDPTPRYRQYPDRGCFLYPSCLSCPLPKCFFELTLAEKRRLLGRGKSDEIIERLAKGEDIEAIARALGVSVRTIQRAVKRYKANG